MLCISNASSEIVFQYILRNNWLLAAHMNSQKVSKKMPEPDVILLGRNMLFVLLGNTFQIFFLKSPW